MLRIKLTIPILSVLLFLGVFAMSCEAEERAVDPVVVQDGNANNDNNNTQADFSVLFVGNSLTYFNSLPILVEEEAARRGIEVRTEELAFPNYALIDHWNDGNVQDLIETGAFDFVVVQQGPSSQPYGRMILIQYGQLFKDLCVANDTELAFFMVWPSIPYYHTFEGVIANYSSAAQITGSILCPVGELWRDHITATGDYGFYGPDGFHPSQEGSEFAARIIVDSLF